MTGIGTCFPACPDFGGVAWLAGMVVVDTKDSIGWKLHIMVSISSSITLVLLGIKQLVISFNLILKL